MPGDFRVRKAIVRRKHSEQRAVSTERHTNSMSHRTTLGIVALAALTCAAGAFYWLHVRGSRPAPEIASPEPPGFRETPPTRKHPDATGTTPSAPSDARKTAPPADPPGRLSAR